jgi:LmbE family N-acetylglucosaminyl deacetylase/protein-L-isoaspartate O-methyltransferase
VVSFDARVDGTPASEWALDHRIMGSPVLDLHRLHREGISRVVVVAPHPDDETLGAGGLMSEAAKMGLRVEVIVVTDGSASHPGVSGLANTRRDELLRAVNILAPAGSVSELNFSDGLVLEERESVRTALADRLRGLGPETLLVVPWSGDGHRDHRIVGELCADLSAAMTVRVIEYPIWLWHWGATGDTTVPWDRFIHLDLSPAARADKKGAIQQFESQLGSVLLDSFIEHFSGETELFMDPETSSTGPARLEAPYFDALYERHDDPWSFESRWYEKRKRAITLASLPDERYQSALEIGCSIGTITEMLAERCDSVLAIDISEAAVEQARQRLAGTPGAAGRVEVRQADVATDFPAGDFDLVVMSEVGYYFDRSSLEKVLAGVLDQLSDTGTLVACHWLHDVADYPLSGETVHSAIRGLPGISCLLSHREDDFLLEVFSRDPRSVADREGLV